MSELLLAGCDAQARLCQNLQDTPLGRAAWNKLLAQSETRSVFLTWQWLSTWWECFHEGAELYTFAVERDGELVGIAPLMLRRQGGARIVEFLGMGSSDYCDFIASEDAKPDVVRAVLEGLAKRRDRWDVLRLRYLPAHSSTARLLQALTLPPGWELQSQVEATCPALSIETSRAFAETCVRKKSLVRHRRYFERLGPLEFYHALDVDEILDRLPEFFEQHRDRRFMAGDGSLFDDPRHRRFYERMVPAMLECNALRFSVLRWNGETLAYHLGFVFDGVFTWYKPTFNVDWARYSPGEVLLQKLLQDAIDQRLRVFDFTVGDEAFKERFANVKNQNLCVEVLQGRRRPRRPLRDAVQGWVKTQHPELYGRLKQAHAELQENAVPENLADVVSTRRPGRLAPLARAPRLFGVASRVLWQAAPLQAAPSEFSAQWARYSHLKLITRREGLNQRFLAACIDKLRRGERAVVAVWHERPVALLWLARDPAQAASEAGLEHAFPPGAALVTDSYLALDLRGSPRRETLPATLLTFLAAEGVSALFGIQDTRHPASLLGMCGAHTVPLARRLDVQLLRWRIRPYQRFTDGV